MTSSRFQVLMDKFKLQSLTPAEQEELLAFAQEGGEEQWLHLLEQMINLPGVGDVLPAKELVSKELSTILSVDKPKQPREGMLMPVANSNSPNRFFIRKAWYGYAAVLVLCLGVAAYVWLANKQEATPVIAKAESFVDIAPGTEGAVLTLADGTQMILDSLGNGKIANQNGVQVMLKDGQLTYGPSGAAVDIVTYNTMRTPRGRQFQLILPDGSKVWLNAASSIKYPTAFTGAERKVEIKGEAYFEVAQNTGRPFKVKVNDSIDIEVLGTEFNINCYDNERSFSTTLLSGAVRVNAYRHSQQLKPGQQAVIASSPNDDTQTGSIKLINNANIDQVTAWKNGVFDFDNAELQTVMQELERWYDIEVRFEGNNKEKFTGKIDRSLSLRELLDGLGQTKVHYRIDENRRVVILP